MRLPRRSNQADSCTKILSGRFAAASGFDFFDLWRDDTLANRLAAHAHDSRANEDGHGEAGEQKIGSFVCVNHDRTSDRRGGEEGHFESAGQQTLHTILLGESNPQHEAEQSLPYNERI